MGGRISEYTVQQVMERVDMPALIGEYTRLERRGEEWWGCCPFHTERHLPSVWFPARGCTIVSGAMKVVVPLILSKTWKNCPFQKQWCFWQNMRV